MSDIILTNGTFPSLVKIDFITNLGVQIKTLPTNVFEELACYYSYEFKENTNRDAGERLRAAL